jgi:hypothetical protein
VFGVITFLGCKNDHAVNRRRVEENLRRLAVYEKGQLEVDDGPGFRRLGPLPEGKPWDVPRPLPAGTPVALLTNPAGLLEEQYEVILDPHGRPGAMLATLGKDAGAKVKSASKVPGWFEVRVRGRVGQDGEIKCLGLRGELQGGDLLNDPKYVESRVSCDPDQ